jgi:hypothetical protein
MPYADPAEKAEYNRIFFLRRYQSDPEFREDEALRKKKWYDTNQARIVAAYRKKRKKMRAAQRVVKSGKPVHCVENTVLFVAQGIPVLF